MKRLYSSVKNFVLSALLTLAVAGIVSCNSCTQKQKSVIFGSSDSQEQVSDVYSEESDNCCVDAEEHTVASASEEEGVAEGLSQFVGESLEQPAEILSEVILFKNQFIVSYNSSTNCPNYVAWRLAKGRLEGSASRSSFIGDDAFGESYRVETADYSGSGYDRGHMCPAADNKNDEMAMVQSFMMTNICPQNHNLNSGDWKELEEQCRQWVKDYSDLYIVCGPIFDSENPKKIGKRKNVKICVPDRFFKVILMLGRQPKAIGFIYPNEPTNKDMRDYCVSVDQVEKITGFDFYPNLDDEIEKKVEKECNPDAWGI